MRAHHQNIKIETTPRAWMMMDSICDVAVDFCFNFFFSPFSLCWQNDGENDFRGRGEIMEQ